jgi:hypothetical protein
MRKLLTFSTYKEKGAFHNCRSLEDVNMGRFISARSEIHRDQWKKLKEKMKDYELSRLSVQAKFAMKVFAND